MTDAVETPYGAYDRGSPPGTDETGEEGHDMGYGRKWKPSRSAAKAFAQQMSEIDAFCAEHGIASSRSNDSYYFTLNGQRYRVSNHSIEASNAAAFDELFGQTRDLYHAEGRKDDVVYIHASKTRIVEIYSDLAAGYELDGRGNRITGTRD